MNSGGAQAVVGLGLIGLGIFVWYELFTGKIKIPFGINNAASATGASGNF